MTKTTTVQFSPARDGGVMTKVDGRVAFPDRRLWRGRPQPQDGDIWEVEIAGENPRQTVYFLRPVRRVSTRAEREAEERAWGVYQNWKRAQRGRWMIVGRDEGVKIAARGGEAALNAEYTRRVDEARRVYDRLFGDGEWDAAIAKRVSGDRPQAEAVAQGDMFKLVERVLHYSDLIDAGRIYAREMRERFAPGHVFALARAQECGQFDGDPVAFAQRVRAETRAMHDAGERIMARARAFLARIPRREMEHRTIEVDDFTVRISADSDWGLHEADPGFSVVINPVIPDLVYTAYGPVVSDHRLISGIVGDEYDPHDVGEGAEDEYERGVVEECRLILQVADAIAPYRWVRVRVVLSDEARARAEAVIDRYRPDPDFMGGTICDWNGMARIDPRSRELIPGGEQ